MPPGHTHSLIPSHPLHTMQWQPQLDLQSNLVPPASYLGFCHVPTTPISLRPCPSAQATPSSVPVVPACPAQALAAEQPLSPDHPHRQQHSPWPERHRFQLRWFCQHLPCYVQGACGGPAQCELHRLCHAEGGVCTATQSLFPVPLLGAIVLGHPDLTMPPTLLQGPDSHYGTKGLRKVTHESPTTGAKTCFTFCYAAGNNNGTSVEDGQIPEVIFYT